MLALGAVGVVVVVVAVLVVVAVTRPSKTATTTAAAAAPTSLVSSVAGVPASVMATQAAHDTIPSYPVPITGTPTLKAAGKPEIVYIGAEYCPYCAGERWAMVMALSKFGTFHNLGTTRSQAQDVVKSVPSFSFYGSTYISKYLVFDPTEAQTVTGAPLQKVSAANQALENKYDAAPYTQSAGIPFVDLANKWVIDGASYNVAPLQHLSHATVARAAASGNTKYGADIQAVAGVIASRLCQLTGGMPTNVCSSFPKALG